MNIQPLGIRQEKSGIGFKSVYPVIHWVSEANGSYAPAATLELSKKLNRKLVGILNNSRVLKKNNSKFGYAINYLKNTDIMFRLNNTVRSFYDSEGGWKNGFEPIAYLITGDDAIEFDNTLGKKLGQSKRLAPKVRGKYTSAELNIAIKDYIFRGKNFVKSKNKYLYSPDGISYQLHTKFEILRTKTGKIKDFVFKDLKFCPSKGKENPFEKLGYPVKKDVK